METSGEKSQKSVRVIREEETLKFWAEQGIFEKTLEKDAPRGDCIFYDGPPFATGLPHYGHILGGTGKDVIARYKTMQGFRVSRKWGWDTHGLPIETIVEKSLGIKSKREIEEMGLEKFATEARSKVLGFVAEWKKTVERTGRWVDFDGSYKTMDATFIESVWWALGELWNKGLVYEADRVLPYCPRCQTPLANAEIAMDNSYLDITDISVYVKFKIRSVGGKSPSTGSGRESTNTYFLAWTTTPWTLPGNTALAVNPNFTYATVSFEGSHIIMLKEKVEQVFKDKQYEIIGEQIGNDLVGSEYEQLFPSKEKLSEKAFHVYGADFVTADTGTGIVHIAPAFGEDDMRLARENSIPTIKHVGRDGTFQTGIQELDGHMVKPKEDHQSGDVLIIKHLAPTGHLFAKEKIIHAYPHCYRCGTPILYYALSSWFIRVQGEKETLEKLNAGIHWVPEHLRDGRFLHTIKNAPDWNISRNRYWASPLPIWKSADGKMKFIASYDELKKYSKGAVTKIIFVRHGEADHNVLGMSSSARDKHPLTEKGKGQAEEVAEQLAKMDIDVVFGSPILRARQTAEAYTKKTGKEIMFDDRIAEIKSGSWEEQLPTDSVVGPARAAYKTLPIEERYTTKRGGTGESWEDMDRRVQSFLDEVLEKHAGKTILVFAHQGSNESAIKLLRGLSNEEAVRNLFHSIANGSMFPIFVDTKRKRELDPHRPYIDTIKLVDEEGIEYTRIPEVIDCWFESGSMPFAQDHYPFERADWKEKNFPADFVVEYIAQTRTWFYYTLLVSSLLFKKAPFQNVVTTGNLNGDDGKKMSKSLGNFPDPHILIDKYGADALRLYLMSSVLMQGEDTDFDEDAVSEASKKIIARLENCLSFLELYPGDRSVWEEGMQPKGVLDQWIMMRLFEVVETMTAAMDQYHIVDALRPIDLFVDDLSTWYVRRSRERFKGDDALDKTEAQRTLTTVLKTLAQILAPFTPFFAEHMYQKLRTENDPESVHLSVWPQQKNSFFESIVAKFRRPQPSGILQNMQQTRDIISQALEARAKAGIKVRQPLAKLEFSGPDLEGEYLELIKDEVNVKHVGLLDEVKWKDTSLWLDTSITPELELEGKRRDLIRQIQDLRKENNLNPGDVVDLVISQDLQSVFESDPSEVKRVTSVREVSFGDGFEVRKV